MIRYLSYLLTSILLLNACSSSKNWRGTSNSKATRAEFDELNGKQSFILLVPDDDTYLKYYFRVNSGKLETIIKSPKETVLSKKFSAMVTDSIHLMNQKGAKYKIYLKGKQASGKVDIHFTDNLN